MSDITNVIAKQKQLYHNAGANSSATSDAVDSINDFFITVKLPTGSDGNTTVTAANDSVATTAPVDCKLVSAYFATTPTITSTAGGRASTSGPATDTININVQTNGVAVVNFNSDNLAAASGANAVVTLTVNSVNSFLDAGEVCLIDYNMEDNTNNYIEGELVLGFRRQ